MGISYYTGVNTAHESFGKYPKDNVSVRDTVTVKVLDVDVALK